jgi:hypothetical protein
MANQVRRIGAVPNVRVERFAPGDDKKNRAEHHETTTAVVDEKLDPMPGINRGEHARRTQNLVKPEDADRHKP